MKIRYYLRGLGLGILFTSIFFLVSNGSSSQTMSDEQVKARAKELGMIESTVLAEIPSKEAETIVEETIEEEVSVQAETVTAEAEDVTAETVESVSKEETTAETVEASEAVENAEQESVVEESAEETESESETTESEEPESIASNTTPVSIVVNRGEGSDTVSRRLQEAGLVADAYEYDRYLMANGYDKKIAAGEHIIPAGATWEEIAKLLCN